MSLLKFLVLITVYFILTSCATNGPASDPVVRNLRWFSYINGDDLRRACVAGTVDSYRFIYNSQWHKQVQTYEIVVARQPPATLTVQVFSPGSLVDAYLDEMRGQAATLTASAALSSAELAQFRDKIATSGFGGPPPRGAWLRSDQFYWLGMGCENGQFRYHAWPIDPLQPETDLAALAFPAMLMAHDATGVPMAQPHPLDLAPFDSVRARREGHMTLFRVQVGENGIRH